MQMSLRKLFIFVKSCLLKEDLKAVDHKKEPYLKKS